MDRRLWPQEGTKACTANEPSEVPIGTRAIHAGRTGDFHAFLWQNVLGWPGAALSHAYPGQRGLKHRATLGGGAIFTGGVRGESLDWAACRYPYP